MIFGLYYGVMFLPVLLSIFKPRSYSSVVNESIEDEHETQAVLLENFPKKIEIVKNSDTNRKSRDCDSNENMKLQTTT